MASLTISSTAFRDGGTIPSKYTCEGKDVSPALTWSRTPEQTQSLTLIVDDPDAPGGVFTHWVVFNIPPTIISLPEGAGNTARMSNGAQAQTDFGRVGWGGPCPPPGKPHHYRFIVYALNIVLPLPPGTSRKEVHEAMEGHVLAQGQLAGLYQR